MANFQSLFFSSGAKRFRRVPQHAVCTTVAALAVFVFSLTPLAARAFQSAPAEAKSATKFSSKARIAVVSVLGSKVQKVVRSLEVTRDEDLSGAQAMSGSGTRSSRSVDLATAFGQANQDGFPSMTAYQSVDWLNSKAMAAGVDRAIEIEIAKVIRQSHADSTINFILRGKAVLAEAAVGLPAKGALEKTRALLKLLAEVSPAERYIIVSPYSQRDQSAGEEAYMAGTGWIVNRGLNFSATSFADNAPDGIETRIGAFFYARISVFDGKTFELILSEAVTKNQWLSTATENRGLDPWASTAEARREEFLAAHVRANARALARLVLGQDPDFEVEIGNVKPVGRDAKK